MLLTTTKFKSVEFETSIIEKQSTILITFTPSDYKIKLYINISKWVLEKNLIFKSKYIFISYFLQIWISILIFGIEILNSFPTIF